MWRRPAGTRRPSAPSGAAWTPTADALGSRHPIARAARLRTALTRQLVANTALVGLAVFDIARRGGPAAVAIASLVGVIQLGLLGALFVTHSCLRERARDLIADGVHDRGIAEVEAEWLRLGSSHHRAEVARRLADALHAAQHWNEIPVGRRPPPSVCRLAPHSAAIGDVLRSLTESTSGVRAVALLDRLLCGGYAAALYVAPADAIARDLGRIRFLLADAGATELPVTG